MPIPKLCHVLLDCHEDHPEEDPDSYDCSVYDMGRFGLLVGPLPTHAKPYDWSQLCEISFIPTTPGAGSTVSAPYA
jgi:hypothetical protein